MDKQLNLLYFSATDTTAKIVKAVAEGIKQNYKEYNLTMPVSREKPITFGDNDIVIVGIPVYAGRVPDFLTKYFAKVKGNNTPAIFIVVYGNRHYDDALLELKNIFENNGFIGVAGGAFIGEHSFTNKVAACRPDLNDLGTAKAFGAKINNKFDVFEDIVSAPTLEVKGDLPYRVGMPKIPAIHQIKDTCINCGICGELCPMGAINMSDFSNVDGAKCILCCSCVKKCPVQAKSIHHEMLEKTQETLIKNFSAVRKEPEIFI